MSIYATLATFKIERGSFANDWIEIIIQSVPGHIGHPECGYEDGDPYAGFLPPVVEEGEDSPYPRAVVITTADDEKDGQRYLKPIATLTGETFMRMRFLQVLDLIDSELQRRSTTREG